MMMRNGKKQEKGSIRDAAPRLKEYMRSSIGIMLFALVLAALSAVMTIIGPNKIGDMATLMSDGLTPGLDLKAIARLGVFLAGG